MHHLLEINRVCCKRSDESNFHIFHILLHGAPENLLKDLYLDKNNVYEVLHQLPTHIFCHILCSLFSTQLQYIPNLMTTYPQRYEFEELDQTLSMLGIANRWVILSAIINIGNIKIESDENDRLSVSEESKKYLDNAAALLNIKSSELTDSLFTRSLDVAGTKIT